MTKDEAVVHIRKHLWYGQFEKECTEQYRRKYNLYHPALVMKGIYDRNTIDRGLKWRKSPERYDFWVMLSIDMRCLV